MYGLRRIVSIDGNRIKMIRRITSGYKKMPILCLPKIIEEYGFKIGSDVEVEISNEKIVIKPIRK